MLAGAPLEDVVAAVAGVIADVDPHVVVTMDETGGDGHRDHVRIAIGTDAQLAALRDLVTGGG